MKKTLKSFHAFIGIYEEYVAFYKELQKIWKRYPITVSREGGKPIQFIDLVNPPRRYE